MNEERGDPHRVPGHHISDARDHAKQEGDGTRAALPPQPAGKRGMRRSIKVSHRSPFLPDHHHAWHGLSAHPSIKA